MKPHQAVALALVGWYLMVPPLSANRHHVDYAVPFAEWIKFGEYDSFGKCEQARTSLARAPIQIYTQPFAKHGGDAETFAALKDALSTARCFRFDQIAN